MSECQICCEKLNKSTRNPVQCAKCQEIACRSCTQNYLLQSADNPRCMFCNVGWTIDYITTITTKVFHNVLYRKYRANITLDREKGLLVETQPLVENILHKRKLNNELIKLRSERQKLSQKPTQYFASHPDIIAMNKEIQKIQANISKRTNQLIIENGDLKIRIKNIDKQINSIREELSGKEKRVHKQLIKACPEDDCRGFISSSWKCGLCEREVCSKCHVIKDDVKHECNPDDVSSAKLIMKETKPCPTCAIPIFKILGCDQMFCVLCHTPFSWTTGLKVTGVIHNPHFYEWQRSQNNGEAPRNPGDVVCGGMPSINSILEHLDKMHISYKEISDIDICNRHRLVNHIIHVEIPALPHEIMIETNQQLRIQYLLNELSEHKWVAELKKQEKKCNKNNALVQILRMFTTVLTDIFANILEKDHDGILKTWEEMNNLRLYVNKSLYKIHKQYNNIVPYIYSNWEIGSINKKDQTEKITIQNYHNVGNIPLARGICRIEQTDKGRVLLGPKINSTIKTGYVVAKTIVINYDSKCDLLIKAVNLCLSSYRTINSSDYILQIFTPITSMKCHLQNDNIIDVGSRVKHNHNYGCVIKKLGDNRFDILLDSTCTINNVSSADMRLTNHPLVPEQSLILEKNYPFKIDINSKSIITHKFIEDIRVKEGQLVGITSSNKNLNLCWQRTWEQSDAYKFNYLYSLSSVTEEGSVMTRTLSSQNRFAFNIEVTF